MVKLEHANLSVRNTEAMKKFIMTAFPDFRLRGGATDSQGRPWCHVGNDDFYVALQSVPESTLRAPYDNATGLNHLGWEVDDLDVLAGIGFAAPVESHRDETRPSDGHIGHLL